MKILHLKILFIISVTATIPVAAQTKLKLEGFSLFEREFWVSADSVSMIYQLPDSFLIFGTDSIWVDSMRLLPNQDYALHLINGQIIFKKSFQDKKQFRFKYHVLPVNLQTRYFHRRIRRLPAENDSLPGRFQIVEARQAAEETGILGATSELQKSGSIVRGISVGNNQGLKLDSGLRMQISGKIADQVEVIAALTDQNTPIQPEGNTQSLQEIDKVYVQVKGEHFDATLGDYFLEFQDGEFGRYDRKLQGAMTTLRFGHSEATFSGAISRGQFTTNQFEGTEGNQGPYQLTGAQGQINIIVIAGTEKVWIDGEPMTRGENNDYVIEYGNGQITFTRNRLITDASRITVDFQYSDQKFRRNLYTSQFKTNLWQNKFLISGVLVREADDKENPLDFTLTEENRNSLAQAGDQMDSAYVASAVFAGENKGAYIQVDSADVRFYRYVGENEGDYSVNFTYVGYGSGDYQLRGLGKYHYIGPEQGSYVAKVLLYPAQKQQLAQVQMKYSPTAQIQIENELALSDFDINTYSGIDDGDNQGFAYRLRLGISPKPVPRLGQVRLNGNFRYVNPRFQSIDRATEVEYNRLWDLGDVTSVQEKRTEISGAYLPIKDWEFSAKVGQIEKGTTFNSTRYEFSSQLTQPGFPNYNYRLESIKSNDAELERTGNWLRQKGTANYHVWKLAPQIGFEQEIKKDTYGDSLSSSGFRFDDVSAGLKISPSQKISLGATVSHRDEKDRENDHFQPESKALTQQYEMQFNPGRSFSSSLNYTHRTKRFFNDESDKRTDLAEIRLNFSTLKRALSTGWNYQISNTQSAQRERQYLEVAQGEGSYRYDADLKEFVPDALGDYDVRIVNTNIFIPVIELRSSLQLRFDANRLIAPAEKNEPTRKTSSSFDKNEDPDFFDLVRRIPWRGMARQFSSETMVRVDEKTKEDDVWDIYSLQLKKYQTDSTIYGTLFFQQTCYFGKAQQKFSLRLRFQQENTMNRQYVEGGESRLNIERSAQITTSPSRLFSAQLEFSSQRKRRQFSISGRENRNVRSLETALEISIRPRQSLELALKTRWAGDVDEYPETPTEATLLALIPRVDFAFRSKGRMRAQFEWTKVDATKEVLPYEMVYGNAPGLNQRWELSMNYRISKNMQGSFSYQGRNEKRRGGIIHIGRAEVRAFF